MTDNIKPSEWFPNLDKAIGDEIKVFPTKALANDAARPFGWTGRVIRISRKFEKVWAVGQIDFQPTIEGDVAIRVLRMPLLRWERRKDGVTHCPVVEFRQAYNKQEEVSHDNT